MTTVLSWVEVPAYPDVHLRAMLECGHTRTFTEAQVLKETGRLLPNQLDCPDCLTVERDLIVADLPGAD